MSVIHLQPHQFTQPESTLVEDSTNKLSASIFRYASGVCAVRLHNSAGELVLLPFHGQQIWRAMMNRRDLSMRSIFSEPVNTREYLANYGAFFLHCGFTAIGAPSHPNDKHPLHGELPNAPYARAHIELGQDARGAFIALGGEYEHKVAFSYNYLARPLVKLYADSALFNISLNIENRMSQPLEHMYLAHINFCPVNESRLVYGAHYDAAHVRVRTSIPGHIPIKPGYRELIETLAKNPTLHHDIKPGLRYDPEVVFTIDYIPDADGHCHTLQLLPDGSSDYVRHTHSEFGKVIRWLCRTDDCDALGMAELATAEVEGFTAEKAKGNVKTLAPGDTWRVSFDVGSLSPRETAPLIKKVDALCGRKPPK